MVWQRAGSVSVQSGSNTVTGTGVDFAATSRNGDSFIGPDGFTYEVANVASSTVISILPAYKGPSVSGGAYAIMPVQGYDKMLSDAFNNLNNQFGPKLAALGTTGNYDLLPVSKGGTGRTSIGNVIAADIVTSPSDTTAGRVLIVGAGGIGSKDNAPYLGNALNPDNYRTGGLSYFGQFTILGVASVGFLTVLPGSDATWCGQQFLNATTGSIFTRSQNASTGWSTWATYAKGGVNSDITSLSGLTTALSVSQGGTGGKTQADARAGLGLGTAATATAGTLPGNVMPVGAFGAGVDYSTGLTLCSDISGSQVSKTGIYRYSATTAGKPDFGSGYGALQQFSASSDGSGNYGAQLAIDYASTELGMRRLTGSAGWSAWVKLYHTGNTTRAADGTLKAI